MKWGKIIDGVAFVLAWLVSAYVLAVLLVLVGVVR